MGLIAVRTVSFLTDLLVFFTGCLMTLVLGTEIVQVIVFVSGLVIFFANAKTLALDESIN